MASSPGKNQVAPERNALRPGTEVRDPNGTGRPASGPDKSATSRAISARVESFRTNLHGAVKAQKGADDAVRGATSFARPYLLGSLRQSPPRPLIRSNAKAPARDASMSGFLSRCRNSAGQSIDRPSQDVASSPSLRLRIWRRPSGVTQAMSARPSAKRSTATSSGVELPSYRPLDETLGDAAAQVDGFLEHRTQGGGGT